MRIAQSNVVIRVMLSNNHQKKSDIDKFYILGRPNTPLNLIVILEGIEYV